jgi:CAAX protease family protein
MPDFGLNTPVSWVATLGSAAVGLAVILAYSPLADRIATRWVARPPNLAAFRTLQQSRAKLAAGIIVAWVLGGFLEEIVFRGVVLRNVESWLSTGTPAPVATGVAVGGAAIGAGLLHLYQRLRAALIVTQLSLLFGVLYVVSGRNLWTVILCHGGYDTIAFIRFAAKKSRYAQLDGDLPP